MRFDLNRPPVVLCALVGVGISMVNKNIPSMMECKEKVYMQ